MARSYSISQISQSGGPGVPGHIQLSASVGDITSSFQGKFYRNQLGGVLPGYTLPAPAGYTLIQATTFDVIDNISYNGRYTVYSQVDASDLIHSSIFTTGTNISVNEVIGVPSVAGNELNTGHVTNISTYLIAVAGEASVVVPPATILSDRPIEMIGRNGTPWGESYTQNFIQLAQNFASPTAPAKPYFGQTWFNNDLHEFLIWNGSVWVVLGSSIPGANSTFRFTEISPSYTWTVQHNLNLVSPYVCLTQIFVDRGAEGFRMILPSDLTFVDANTISISFSNPETGVVLIRP
jgi:hypothetical protein